MSKLFWLIGVLLIAVTSYTAAIPYITITHIKTAVSEQDSEALSENIDFTVLRQNIKEQLIERVTNFNMSEMKDNPMGALAIAAVSTFVDGKADSYISPSGLASLMEGKIPGEGKKSETTELLKNARYTYDSTSEFSAWVPTEKGEEIRFVLYRNGLDWKLENIVLPVSD